MSTRERSHEPSLLRRAWGGFRRLWIVHVALLCMAGIFAFPFVWMLAMSLKTDEESTSTDIFPAVPSFRGHSPFVREAPLPTKPALADAEKWEATVSRLMEAARLRAVQIDPPTRQLETSERDALREAAARAAVAWALDRIDQRLWETANTGAIYTAIVPSVTNQVVASFMIEQLGRLELGGMQLRSLDGRTVPIAASPTLWRVLSGPGTLEAAGGMQTLAYHFDSTASEPVMLQATIDPNIGPNELHRLAISYKGDASWNRFDVEVDIGGRRLTSEQSSYIAQHRAASILLQPYTFQDEMLTPRNWITLSSPNEARHGTTQPTQATITMTLRPSSTLRAIWSKVERNYVRAFRAGPFWTYVGNSMVIVVMQLAGALFSSSFVAYAFARLNWPGRAFAFGLLLSTMMLPGQVTMIPSFLIWKSLGWYNTLNPLWIGAWLGNAFFIFLMIQHMRTIPKELDEAARIDGMGAVQTWWYVIVPQVKPALAAIAIMTFMGAWNDFMGPLILLRDQERFPLSLGLFSMRLDAFSDWSLIMAGNVLMTLPVIVIFFLFQRYFVEGVAVTGMKG